MRKALKVARREYRAIVRTKGFIIGLLFAPLLMGGGILATALLKDRVDTRDKKVVVLDRSGLLAEALVRAAEAQNSREVLDPDTGKKLKPAYHFEAVPPDGEGPQRQRLELSDRVREGDLHAFIEIGAGVLHPRKRPGEARVAYHAANPAIDDLRRWIESPLNEELRRLRLKDAGIEESAVEDLFDWIPAEGLGLLSTDPESGEIREAERKSEIEAVAVAMIPMMFMFLMIMMGAMPHLQSVMQEKSQRIAEVVLGSVSPFEFMLGKLIGGVAVSLTGAAVYLIGGIATVHHLGLGGYVPYHIVPWFLAYTVLANLMFGAMLAALGSACNDPVEAQSVTLPAILPLMIPIFLVMPVVEEPLSAFATGLSLFPLFTPIVMLVRQATPVGVPAWQPWVGLGGVALTAVFFVWVGGRVFRVGILMQGTPPKLRNILRWAIRG